MPDLPEWLQKLNKRLLALEDGVYAILIFKDNYPRWNIEQKGKVER